MKSITKEQEKSLTYSDKGIIKSLIGILNNQVNLSGRRDLMDCMKDLREDFSRSNPDATSNDGMDMAIIGIQILISKLYFKETKKMGRDEYDNLVYSFNSALSRIGAKEIQKRGKFNREQVEKDIARNTRVLINPNGIMRFYVKNFGGYSVRAYLSDEQIEEGKIFIELQKEKGMPTSVDFWGKIID